MKAFKPLRRTFIDSHRARGTSYEEKTLRWFESKPEFEIVARNYSIRGGEIDLIAVETLKTRNASQARDTRELVFIEVRYRDSESTIDAIDSITPTKKRHILRVARFFLAHERIQADSIRFDLVAWKGERISHMRDAWRY